MTRVILGLILAAPLPLFGLYIIGRLVMEYPLFLIPIGMIISYFIGKHLLDGEE